MNGGEVRKAIKEEGSNKKQELVFGLLPQPLLIKIYSKRWREETGLRPFKASI